VLDQRHLVCRHGGDEFCILLRNVSATEAQAEGDRIVLTFRKHPIGIAGNQLGITISAGLAMVEPDTSAEEVLSRANSALHAAKARGKNRCRFYHSGSTEIRTIRNSAEWVSRIEEGLEEKRFEIWYQPMVQLSDSVELCREALLRYRGDDGQLHYPSEFMPGAERYNMMSKLADLREHADLHASINLSGNSITEPGMVDFLMSAFEKSGVSPERVIFEITETVFIANLTQAQAMVRHLQDLGCQFALDDFGSGFSSLNYLKNLPVNIVKIDGSFIQSIATDNVDYALLRSINEIAHLLGKRTVAEYVDSDNSWQMLEAIGVDYGQGFHIGKPAPLRAVGVEDASVPG
jgi:EAL domain-containing protein (putative c-di-GMP-specific phosphodiesterase class I)